MLDWLQQIPEYLKKIGIYSFQMGWRDVLEIVIIAFLLYYLLAWMKNTRAWALLKGLIVIGIFLIFANIAQLSTIKWLTQNILQFAVIALIVVLQPELRKALEELGKKNIVGSWFLDSTTHRSGDTRLSVRSINEIAKACAEMGRVRTGALIVIEMKETLKEYERTGIEVDAMVTSQLLINIFEKNTPLHDGAVLVRGNRVSSATCYLPLSDNLTLGKELGTRHRAGVGISEATDSVTIIVSEETGRISVAHEGKLERNLDQEQLKARLKELTNNSDGTDSEKSRRRKK